MLEPGDRGRGQRTKLTTEMTVFGLADVVNLVYR